jgi:hypothetical protein
VEYVAGYLREQGTWATINKHGKARNNNLADKLIGVLTSFVDHK